MQSLPLEAKIEMSKRRIKEWYESYDGDVYVAFSGGIMSTVLLRLVRELYPEVPAVFCDTGLEFPSVRDFALEQPNVTPIYPVEYDRKSKKYKRVSFRQVIEKYGYPVISKEQSSFIREYRTSKSEKLKTTRLNGNRHGQGKISEKWKFLIEAPFPISEKCCSMMKKIPSHLYEKETGRKPIIGTAAGESSLRKSNWLRYGCNAFNATRPTSRPLSFWTGDDFFQYIVLNNVDFADVYGEIIWDGEHGHATGEPRTGCMFCMFGCGSEKEPNKFQRMKKTHPKQYEYCMRDVEDGGLGIRKVLDYIGVKYE